MRWTPLVFVLLFVLAGCAGPAPPIADGTPMPANIPRETLVFNATVHILQAGIGLVGASLPPDESCMAVQVPRGWVPVRFVAGQIWEPQSDLAQELWLALFEDQHLRHTAAAHGPSPVHLSHEWALGQYARTRTWEGNRLLAFSPSQSMAGAVIQQEVHMQVAVTFAKYPEFDDVPHLVPCYEVL